MRFINFLADKTNVFFMGIIFDFIDTHILESSKIDQLNWVLQMLLLVFVVLPFLILGLIIVIFIMTLHAIEKLFTSLIYRNKIIVNTPTEHDDPLIENLEIDFGRRFNSCVDHDNHTIILYFFKEADLGWFILKYGDYLVKKAN